MSETGDEQPARAPLRERIRDRIRRRPRRSALVAIAALAVLVGGVLYYLHTRTYEDTDDAQIDGDISAVSARVAGTVAAVHVVDNQVVHAGDPIAELDPRDLDTAVAQARAQLAQAEAQLAAQRPSVSITAVTTTTTISTAAQDVATAVSELASAERDYEKAQADIEQARANDRYAQLERARSGQLASVGAVAMSQSDQWTTSAEAASAALAAALKGAEATRAHVAQQRAKLAAARKRAEEAKLNAPEQVEAQRASVSLQEAAVAAAKAQLDQAELNRSYARIVAPVDGIAGKKSVNVGDRVQPGQQLVAITQIDHLWVTANYRETQLREMRPGQRARVHVDAFGFDLDGTVESLPGATGSRYSLLPPENATGNYVKVVQRLSVRIRLRPGQRGLDRIRPGMSVEPKVWLE